MELEQIRAEAAQLFPLAVRFAIEQPGKENPSLKTLHRLCADHHERLGFECHADCFAAVVPKLEGRLSLDTWCRTDLMVSGYEINVHLRPFYLGAAYAHIEIRHNGPLPGLTETGYRSTFTPLATFAEFTLEEYLAEMIPAAPREQQLTLF